MSERYKMKRYFLLITIMAQFLIAAEEKITPFTSIIIEEKVLVDNNRNLSNLKNFNLSENGSEALPPSEFKNIPNNSNNTDTKPKIITPLKKIISNEPQPLAWSFVGNKKFVNIRFGENTMFLKEKEKYKDYEIVEISKQYVIISSNSKTKKYYFE